MQSNNSTFYSIPSKELVLLARHICRTTGSISLTTLFEYFPTIDMRCNLQIIDSLLLSGHIKRTGKGHYTFIDLENRLETGELEEEVDTLGKVKQGVLDSACINLPSGTLERVTDDKSKHSISCTDGETSRVSEPKESVRNSTLFEELEKDLPMIATQRLLFTKCKEGTTSDSSQKPPAAKPASPSNSAYLWSRSAAAAKYDQIQKSRSKSSLWNELRRSSQPEIGFDDEFRLKLKSCIRSPSSFSNPEPKNRPTEVSTASGQPVTPMTPKVYLRQLSGLSASSTGGHDGLSQACQISQHIQQIQQRYQWKKPIKKDEVRDPRKALEIFCAWDRMKPPAYTVTFMPNDSVYYCLVLVGNTSFKSYPTMARTEKRAMEVAAEKAVEALGLTDSMIQKLITDTRDGAN